ncbi:MAG: class I SAM-dependent rRNA methyltransferase [Chitinispirillales bacterium]|jgi:23S rRNA (cytosine1962-C5)-methyltransferase|nr:class I SAM-dependent rRNA methyltransferase [Chitinispirillales bacterium]
MKVVLKKGKEKLVAMGHPWVFSGAVGSVEGKPDERGLCGVYSHNGGLLGTGYYNEKSAIRIRMLSKGSSFTAGDLRQRLSLAIERRCGLLTSDTDSCRVINSEGDFLPGLTVDRYGSGICLQIGTAGMEAWRAVIIDSLSEMLSPSFIYERSDTEARKREGLADSEGLIKGSLPDPLIIRENGVSFLVNLVCGQKTGFFFDQRDSRALVRRYSAGRIVCDCFSYSGGFAVNAAKGGALSVAAVDASANAGKWLSQNAGINGADINFTEADVFSFLRQPGGGFDLLILDPPKFARHAGEVDRAARGYKDINLAGFRKLTSGGLLFTFSCSNAVDPYLFRQIVFSAAADARRQAQLLHVLTAGPDHPVNIAHKEGEYLKGLVLRVF